MSIFTALSGISAAQSDISTTAHNIANVGTYGFKTSRVEFADIFSSSPLTVARTAIGSGVQVAGISQSFTQGNVTSSGNVLDLAIEGPGFFAIRTTTGAQVETQYTRAGAFRLNADGAIVNAAGSALLGWPVARDGSALSTADGQGQPMRLPATSGTAKATNTLSLGASLPTDPAMLGAQGAVPPTAAFSPDDPSSYAFSTPITVLDESGTPRSASMYFSKVDEPDATDPTTTWRSHLVVGGVEVTPTSGSADVVLGADGAYISGGDAAYDVSGEPLAVSLDQLSLSDAPFTVTTASQDGKGPAALYAIEIDATGTVYASYADGEAIALGKVMLANFPNAQGLRQMGATALSSTALSGEPILGMPGESGFGYLRSGALERSNVDLTQELVNLITAQRNYQASAKAMETSNSLSQTIINMRS